MPGKWIYRWHKCSLKVLSLLSMSFQALKPQAFTFVGGRQKNAEKRVFEGRRWRLQPGSHQRLIIGLYGAGPKWNPGNTWLRNYVKRLGGEMILVSAAKRAIIAAGQGATIHIIGYSRGGTNAVSLANWAGKRQISIQKLVTIDPHRFFGDKLYLKYDNVVSALNYYQRNPRTGWGPIGWWGVNPYTGSALSSQHTLVENIDLTGVTVGGRLYGHNDIVRRVTAKLD